MQESGNFLACLFDAREEVEEEENNLHDGGEWR
jgi:hypothetical protein